MLCLNRGGVRERAFSKLGPFETLQARIAARFGRWAGNTGLKRKKAEAFASARLTRLRDAAVGIRFKRLPRQDFPDAEIAGVFSSDDENTTKSTTSASMFAECIYDHLDDAQLAELLSRLELGVQR